MPRVAVKVAEIQAMTAQEDTAAWIVEFWDKYNQQRSNKIEEWAEVDKYIFATDTTTTSNQTLPWTHNTTIPKLTQIRDNLHSNYISSLFPNDKWLTWQAFTKDAAVKRTADTIKAYMENKTREGGFRTVVSRLLYDYIDKGNCFAMPTFETRYKTYPNGDKVKSFVGPKAVRISPYDIVFNPVAENFASTPKVVRSLMTVGDLKRMAETYPEHRFWTEVLERRQKIGLMAQSHSIDDWAKASQYEVDGFGSLQEYYAGDVVEVLEFYGDFHNKTTGELSMNRMITIADRSVVARDEPISTYGGEAPIRHAGWRFRGDNLWAMGPLDNLVGMQYMLDHYMNMGANALDLKVMAPKKIIGEVEEFEWKPNAEIIIDENGDVQELAQNFGDVFAVKDYIQELEFRMELYAGAPREAMGIRTPGEKTAFEVQALENAAGRIFQEKVVQFELFLEELLNDMLEISHRHLDFTDVISIMDKDIGVQQFKDITRESITANGILRPIGARHFAQKAQELQNLMGVLNNQYVVQKVDRHISSTALTKFLEDVVDLRGYEVFKKNIAVQEEQELQALMGQAVEDNKMEQMGLSEEEMMVEAAANEA